MYSMGKHMFKLAIKPKKKEEDGKETVQFRQFCHFWQYE